MVSASSANDNDGNRPSDAQTAWLPDPQRCLAWINSQTSRKQLPRFFSPPHPHTIMFAPFPSSSLLHEERENMNMDVLYRKRKSNKPHNGSNTDLADGSTVAQDSFEDQYHFYGHHPDDNIQRILEDDGELEDWSEDYDDIIARLESTPSLDPQRRYLSLLESRPSGDGSGINKHNYSDESKIKMILN